MSSQLPLGSEIRVQSVVGSLALEAQRDQERHQGSWLFHASVLPGDMEHSLSRTGKMQETEGPRPTYSQKN